jgi:hypothetical protein
MPELRSREDVGGERIDREDVRQAVGGEMVRLAIADSGIVDNGVKTAEPVELRRHILGADATTILFTCMTHALAAVVSHPQSHIIGHK